MIDDLTRRVKAEAQRLGFTLAGVTRPDPPPHFPIFERWVALGHHGAMGYLASPRSLERRADPMRILPECRSIVMLAFPYGPAPAPDDQPSASPSGPIGRVAAYAWGADYHDLLPERLQQLGAFIEAQVGRPVLQRAYTDTGPLLERDLAQRAGLGWAGKNTCLIHPRRGSYFLLAALLLDIELAPDPPFITDHCGSCTRCIEACPTGCILPDRTLDARKCLSYLTIELKGPIPSELRPQLGDWVFGCDVCQQVCPWNLRFACPAEESALAERPGVARPALIAEMSLSAEAFNRKFKGSPVQRSKRRGYLRNVAVALGNAADPAAVPALAAALAGDPEPLVRQHAAWALGQIGGEQARSALEQAAKSESDPQVLAEIHDQALKFNNLNVV